MSEPRLLLGDCVERLRDLDDASIDAIVTDPPYGLGKEPPIADVLEAWLAGRVYVPTGGGFMGKTWDAFVPDLAVWRECFRVLKPGGYLLSFSGTRTVELVAIGIRLAGFERRDLYAWLYGSGFPKSLDVSKAIDKAAGAEREVVGYDAARARPNRRYESGAIGNIGGTGNESDRTDNGATIYRPATVAASEWEGWGTALKPALEPIVVARKPLVGTVAANVLAYGTGALNIDACRVETSDALGGGAETITTRAQKGNEGWERPWMDDEQARESHAERVRENVLRAERLGRWPANVLLSHTPDCVLVGERQVAADGHGPSARPAGSAVAGASGHVGQEDLDERTARGETVEVWDCAPDCAVRLLDAQTGELQSGEPGVMRLGENRGATFGSESRPPGTPMTGYGDAGGASRFFYTAKTSRAERNAGLGDDFEARQLRWSSGDQNPGSFQSEGTDRSAKNDHPTVKPVELMRWLVRLVARPGAVVCDPFLGSGTTGIACGLEGVDFVGIEREPEYLAIAEARIRFWAEHGDDALRIVSDRDQADRRRQAREDAGQLDLFGQGA